MSKQKPATAAPASSTDDRIDRLADQVERLGDRLVELGDMFNAGIHAVALGLEGIGNLGERIGDLAGSIEQNAERGRQIQTAAVKRQRRIIKEIRELADQGRARPPRQGA
jgi:phosphate uptake regulator